MRYDAAVIGGGIAGCASAQALAEGGARVLLIEKTERLGGKVAEMGCKAAGSCSNCGVCLSAGLWEDVAADRGITVVFETEIIDCVRRNGDFRVSARFRGVPAEYDAGRIVVATGYRYAGIELGTNVEISAASVITGAELERMIRDRDPDISQKPLASLAFLQCYGSRDTTEKAAYCSRVCCSYASRSARLIRSLHPGTEIDMFFMDIQRIGRGCSEDELLESGISIIRARPEKVSEVNGKAMVQFESGGIRRKDYDLVILSCGIAPGEDNERLAELFGLGFDRFGFLREVRSGDLTGVYVAGCAGGPRRIEEARTEGREAAARILAAIKRTSRDSAAREGCRV